MYTFIKVSKHYFIVYKYSFQKHKKKKDIYDPIFNLHQYISVLNQRLQYNSRDVAIPFMTIDYHSLFIRGEQLDFYSFKFYREWWWEKYIKSTYHLFWKFKIKYLYSPKIKKKTFVFNFNSLSKYLFHLNTKINVLKVEDLKFLKKHKGKFSSYRYKKALKHIIIRNRKFIYHDFKRLVDFNTFNFAFNNITNNTAVIRYKTFLFKRFLKNIRSRDLIFKKLDIRILRKIRLKMINRKRRRLFLPRWKHWFISRISPLRCRYYHHRQVSSYYNSIYVGNNLINWYTLTPPKKTKFISNNFYILLLLYNPKKEKQKLYNYITFFKNMISSWQKIKYHNYITWYNKTFMNNYMSVTSLWGYSLRRKDISKFSYNFLYRIYYKKKNIKRYNYTYNKKLSKINHFREVFKSKELFKSYLNDSSFLFFDKIKNTNYTRHFDEKYSFFLKNTVLRRIYSNYKNKFPNMLFLKKTLNRNIFFIFKSKYTINYKKNNFTFFFSTYNTLNVYYKFFYTINVIKYKAFILKDSLFTFFKDFFIHKYKIFIYSYKFKKNIFKKKDTNFMYMYCIEINGTYYGINEVKMKRTLHSLTLSDSLMSINYLDWFAFFYKTVKNIKNSFFSNYYLSYKFFYERKLPFIKKHIYRKHVMFKFFNKYSLTRLKRILRFKNPFFNLFNNNKDASKIKNIYKNAVIKMIKSIKPIKFVNLLKLRGKVSSKRTTKNTKQKVSLLLSKLVGTNKINKPNIRALKFKGDKKVTKSNKNLFLDLWSYYVNNKKVTLLFRINIINYLYRLKTNFLKYSSKINTFLLYFNLLNYLKLRDQYFNVLFYLKKNNKMHLIINKKRHVKQNRSNTLKPIANNKGFRHLWYRSYFYLFKLSDYSNVFFAFFFLLKKGIFNMFLNNTFSIYKKWIFIYSFKNNKYFLRNSFLQFDYNIKNFLNMEVSSIFKKDY